MPKFNDMPDENGVVVEIMVPVGATITRGMVVMSVEMAKANVDVESLHDGTVARILVAEGDKVFPGQVLVELQ